MFFIPLVVCLTSLLCSVPVSCCDECEDKPVFTPSRLIVKHGDSASATCTVCQSCTELFDLEKAVGRHTTNGSTITWTVDSLTEWSTTPKCHYKHGTKQCCTALNVTAYKPPDNVSISLNHSGPMLEAHQYRLQCDVQNVAPVQTLVVTFYRGQTTLARLNSTSNPQKEPVSEVFSLSINVSREDDGAQYWCEAKLELGPEGPQPPPVVKSQNITATVHYKPHVERSSHPDPIVVTAGGRLQLNCSAEGNPPPSFGWRLPVPSPPLPPSLNATTLIIDSVTVQDEGQYVCVISNYIVTKLHTVEIIFNVQVKELETTSLPPTTTATTTTATTTTAPTTAATTTAATTTAATTTAATTTATTTTATTTTTPTTTQTTTTELTPAPSSSTSIALTRWFMTWFMILFSLGI